ncbi:MAG: hypothetical protein FJY17_07185 [Bacteroidetes bacterium]|nr:hypothetical protein [Bacteroidota bacterium]
MKKGMISLVALLLAIFLSGNVYSQSAFSINVGASFPLSDFGEDDLDDDDAGLAGRGLCLGTKFLFPINDKGLGLYFGADLNYNPLNSEVRDDIEDELDALGIDEDVTFRKYINIPVTGGLTYSFSGNQKVSFFCDLGIGFNYLKITDEEYEFENEETKVILDPSTQLAYKIGGGLLLDDKWSIGLHYNGLGEHDVEGKIKYSDGDTENFKGEDLKVSLLTLTLGIKL